jgi:hypothetical protein
MKNYFFLIALQYTVFSIKISLRGIEAKKNNKIVTLMFWQKKYILGKEERENRTKNKKTTKKNKKNQQHNSHLEQLTDLGHMHIGQQTIHDKHCQ